MCTKGWASLTGYKFVEVVNRSNKVLQGPETETENARMLTKACMSGKRTKTHLLNYTKAGKPFINMLEVFPLRDSTGTLTHFCGVLKAVPAPASRQSYARGQSDLPAVTRNDGMNGGNLGPGGSAVAPSGGAVGSNGSIVAPSASGCGGVVSHAQPTAELGAAELGASASAAAGSQGVDSSAAPQRVKRLLNKRVRLADALENQTDAVVLTQPHPPYAITHANGPWCKMCGYTSSEEVEGKTNAILQGPETDIGLVSDLMTSVKREEPATASLVNYKKGGEKFLNQVQVMPVYNDQDELEQFMAMLHEVDSAF